MFGFTKSHRLLKKSDYDYVFSHALKLNNKNFTVLYCKNKLDHARIGLVLSKKIVRKAHDRNKIKRILRESFRLNGYLPAVDIVVLARPAVNQALPHQIRANLGKLWDALSTQHAP
ncbi:MAG: ribonuclease P protein component [Legionellaceae bacterium]|nr:ribonuclease P protein component [Legionellaceae bacterium]